MKRMRIRRVVSTFGALVAFVGIAPAGAASAAPSAVAPVATLSPGPWPFEDELARCRGVVDTAVADYEKITMTLVQEQSRVRAVLRSADDFPNAEFAAKLCTWSDTDGDHRLDPAEEKSVQAYVGPLAWKPGTREAATAIDSLAPGGCARLWISALYPDGHRSTKRSAVACLALAPSATVPESRHAVLFVVSGLVTGAFAVLVLRRRQRASTGTPSYL